MTDVTSEVVLTRDQKKRLKAFERLKRKFPDSISLSGTSLPGGLPKKPVITPPHDEKKGSRHRTEDSASHKTESKLRERVDDDASCLSRAGCGKLSSCFASTWIGSSPEDVARELVVALSLRSEPDAYVFLNRELKAIHDALPLGAALLHCSDRGFLHCVEALISKGAPMSAKGACAKTNPKTAATPLECAAARGHVAVCRSLIQNGAPIGHAREQADSLRQYGKYFAKERAELLALFDG